MQSPGAFDPLPAVFPCEWVTGRSGTCRTTNHDLLHVRHSPVPVVRTRPECSTCRCLRRRYWTIRRACLPGDWPRQLTPSSLLNSRSIWVQLTPFSVLSIRQDKSREFNTHPMTYQRSERMFPYSSVSLMQKAQTVRSTTTRGLRSEFFSSGWWGLYYHKERECKSHPRL